MARSVVATVWGTASSRATRAGTALTVAGGFVLALPFMAGTATAAPAGSTAVAGSTFPFENPAHQKAAISHPASRAFLGAAPAAPAATPAHTFHPVASAPDAPQDPGYLNSGQCHSTNLDGSCTLRAAVMEANAEGKYVAIVLTSGTYHLSIAPSGTSGDASTGDLDITDPGTVTFSGAGPTHTFIDGADMSTGPGSGTGDRIFDLEGNSVASMTGLTVQNGYATNTSSDAGNGGGIDISSRSAALVLQSVDVSDNAADFPSIPEGVGGGVYVNGSLWAKDSQLSGNAARDDGGGLYLGDGSAQLVNVSVTGNTVSREGGGIYVLNGPLSMQRGAVSGNHVVVPDGSSGHGGGLYIEDAATLVGTTISNNTVSMTSGATSGTAQGGGLYNGYGLNQADHLTISNNSVSGLNPDSTCGCGDGGGGIYDYYGMTLTHSILSGNHTTGAGGGLYNYGDNERLSRDTVSNNTAAGDGGGVYADDTTDVTQSTISGNTAGRNGGGFWSDDGQQVDQTLISGNTAVQGGGYWNQWTAELTNDTLTGNTATGTGNAGGGFYNSDGTTNGRAGSAQLTNITISGNRSDDGGGIFDGGGGVAVRNTIIAGNKAVSSSTDTNCDVSQNGALPLTDGGHNLDSGHTCGLAGPGDKSGANPKLSSLANHGGPTKTLALLKGSPAINAGSSPAPSVDQRNVQRDSRPDMGAFERR